MTTLMIPNNSCAMIADPADAQTLLYDRIPGANNMNSRELNQLPIILCIENSASSSMQAISGADEDSALELAFGMRTGLQSLLGQIRCSQASSL